MLPPRGNLYKIILKDKVYFLMLFFITLPVEFNASSRAIAAIDGHAILDKDEITGAKKVLNAAAAAVAILELIRLLVLRNMIEN